CSKALLCLVLLCLALLCFALLGALYIDQEVYFLIGIGSSSRITSLLCELYLYLKKELFFSLILVVNFHLQGL
ncbi:hypothetical protein PP707_06895, partial [Acetobacter pasteurianus]|nr:hypothetical protein [Acetobacter pasteurianus]